MEVTLILNLFSSFFLCGLIWTVQLVHYPAFHGFDKETYHEWMSFHKSRISLVVVPVMLAELGSSFFLVFGHAPFPNLQLAGLIIVLLLWLITFFVQVPLHDNISSGYTLSDVNRLVTSNWIRTILWSLKSAIGIYILVRIIDP